MELSIIRSAIINNVNNILFLEDCQEHAVNTIMTCDESDQIGKEYYMSTGAQTLGSYTQLIMSTSGHVFGKGINGTEFPRGEFRSNGDLFSKSLGVFVAHRVGHHTHASNRNEVIPSTGSNLSWCFLYVVSQH